MRDEEDLYAILQVHPAAEPEIVEAAYRRLARMYHPDVNKSPHAHAIMTRINRAYEILKDPPKRAQYDRECAYRQRQAQPDAQRQAHAEYERREQAQRMQRERQAQHGSARRSYAEWEDERSDTTQKTSDWTFTPHCHRWRHSFWYLVRRYRWGHSIPI